MLATPGDPSTSRKASSSEAGAGASAGSSSRRRASPDGGSCWRSYSGPSSARARAGRRATTSPPWRTTSTDPPRSFPIRLARRPHRVQTSSTASASSGLTMASIRSCDSEVRISNGSMPGSRSGTASRSRSAPTPARAADSLIAQVNPAPPRSWMPHSRPRSASSRQASTSSFSANGSADLDAGPGLMGVLLDGWGGQHAAPADPVPTRRRSDQDQHVALAAPPADLDPVGLGEAQAQDVHGRVRAVAGGELHLAPHRGNPDAVPVPPDPRHHAREQVPVPGVVERPEPERIEQRGPAEPPSTGCPG